jgi:hypothetical protein
VSGLGEAWTLLVSKVGLSEWIAKDEEFLVEAFGFIFSFPRENGPKFSP